MVITKIEPQKKHKNRSSVFLDGSFAFGLSDFDVLRLHLKEGQELSKETLDSLRSDILTQDAKQYALRLLDRQSYTEKALRQKLKDRGCDAVVMESVIDFLKEYHYIDDVSYARHYITAVLKNKKSGLKKIQYDLQEKGINRNIINEVIEELDKETLSRDEQEAILPLLLKKTKGDLSFQSVMKAKRYCLSRGFSSEAIDRALATLKAGGEEEWLNE